MIYHGVLFFMYICEGLCRREERLFGGGGKRFPSIRNPFAIFVFQFYSHSFSLFSPNLFILLKREGERDY